MPGRRPHADAGGDVPLLPAVEEFGQLIERDPEIYMLFGFMLTQTPRRRTPTGKPQVRTVDHMLKLFNHILTHAPEYDDTGLVGCLGYITEVATRARVFIEADNPAIGLMCVLPVGMAEVSTCEITVYEGQHVKKGDQLGMFHYGGSTHCLMFRPGVRLDFDFHGQPPGLTASNIPVNARIATVVRTITSSCDG